MARKKEDVAADEPSFEHSLEELQLIVKRLEEGEIGLELSLGEYERGIGLLRRCYQLLQNAEQRIEILTGFNDAGEPIMQPFDAKATYSPPSKGKQ
ncbi:MAG: exodeoxyribonuclease VII small subunit [Planctomycetota bacterium]|nr:exodeoxyribonuclease VII small subunit [Planctomycetota bacterium]MDA1211151.1 exodeoxyribonuclease VII small subunit [Planctomycetota bacterium]